ncbi:MULTISPECIES: hypothetical protein [Saccharothrix]|uniref:hypothetical protein n=1 Tax=Saccharothrix TaxID=2071 RepID=UPI00093B4368|nr:hypothetical protein [Saccharothrix sp. CB00851]OKI38834.1 hypothetical protein A6A25_01080 [Saccharothrix sp. CB00851]
MNQNPQNWPQQAQQPGYGPPPPGFQQPPPGTQPPGTQPPGFQQPPPPGAQPPGAQPPGFHQPPGYGPPRKKRTGLVIGIVIGVVVLVVGGVVGSMYLNYIDEPGGGPGTEPIAQCVLSDDVKSQAHVSSFRLIQAPTDAKKGMKQTHCAWEQTKGKDGRNPRRLSFLVYDFTTFSDKSDRNLDQAHDNYTSFMSYGTGDQAKTLDLGDESMVFIPASPTDLTEVNLLVRKGTVVWNIRYQGRDKGFFTDSGFPVADAEAVAVKVAGELTSK